jgi:hypothetical protein
VNDKAASLAVIAFCIAFALWLRETEKRLEALEYVAQVHSGSIRELGTRIPVAEPAKTKPKTKDK